MITTYMKVLCALFAFGLAAYNFLDEKKPTGTYWFMVMIYWIASIGCAS